MSQERVFGIAIAGYSLYLVAADNLYQVRQIIRQFTFWLPHELSMNLSYILTDNTILLIFCMGLPFILFSGLFRIRL